ncbi:hypothetical protein N7G274_002707 [Stereocaulon virgatum]|uniref:Uncharacterized protein n=1 Tax=Stereocaulon virgatum TaxID=373712 RepID=A0ABR4AGK7_9LECA
MEGKAKATRKRKAQASAGATAAKLQKAAGAGRIGESKTANESHCQDISIGLSRTKPAPRKRAEKPAKTVSPTEITLLEQRNDAELLQDALLAFEIQDGGDSLTKQSRSLELNEKYQAAYINFGTAGTVAATPCEYDIPTLVVGAAVGGSSLDNETLHEHEPWDDDSDFEPPPSAQKDFVIGSLRALPIEARLDHSKAVKSAHGTFPDDDDNRSGFIDADAFFADDEGHEELMASITPLSACNDWEKWRPQGFSNDHMVADDSLTDNGNSQKDHPLLTGFQKPASSSFAQLQSSCVLTHVSGNASKPKHIPSQTLEGSENSLNDDDLDENLIDLAIERSDLIEQQSTPLKSPVKPSTPKLQWMPPKVFIPAKSSPVPALPTDVTHLVSFDDNGVPLPFMRPPFPAPIRDRSPILGLTNRTVLRTCFRIGESLNAAAVASRANTDAIIELYARIVSSEREASPGCKQSFQFGDMFTDKPPYLSATCNLWKGVGLWDNDSKVFLGEKGSGKMARVIGRIKKGEKGSGVAMVVLSVWEVDWEDVGIAKGIVCS